MLYRVDRTELEIGKVYHQQFQDGERCYCRPVKRFINGRYQVLHTDGRRKPVQSSTDPNLPWVETPENEIPKKLK